MAVLDLKRYTHDLMIMTIKEMYPGLLHGRDFVVAHMISAETNEQDGDPFILWWKVPTIEQPKDDAVHVHFREHEADLRARYIRSLRDEALRNTDGKANPPADMPASATMRTDAWRTYRQALRDLPQQSGFPFEVEWPESPSAQSGLPA